MKTLGVVKNALMGVTAGLLLLTSCSEDVENVIDDVASQVNNEVVEADAVSASVEEDVEALSSAAVEFAVDNAGSRTAEMDERLTCAVIERDTATQTIILTFTGDCADDEGRVRTGSIIITYTGRLFVPGNYNNGHF